MKRPWTLFLNFLKMNNKELYYFTCQCLSLDDHPHFSSEIIQKLSNEADCQRFVHLCSNHWILPTIYIVFRRHEILPHLPDGLTEFLEEVHQLNLSRNERILAQLGDILKLFNRHDIYPTILKGAGNLLDELYSSNGERMMGDIDLLVSDEEYLQTAEILENEGYTHHNPSFFDVMDMTHYPRLFKIDVPVDVEIHRLPVPPNYLKLYNTQIIDQEKVKVNKPGFSCYVLSNKHKIIHNFIHSQLSNKGHGNGFVPLRDLYDLYLMSHREKISETMSHIYFKNKAISYFLFAGRVLNLPDFFNNSKNLIFYWFCAKHDLFLKAPVLYRINKSLLYMADRIYDYIVQLIKLIYSRDMRRSLKRRLSSRYWYENHVNTYIQFFSHNK